MVLALGNFPSGPQQSGKAITTWEIDRFKQIGARDPVFIVGSGLTMVDTVLALKERNHSGQIYALSRHGLIPQTFEAATPYPTFLTPPAMKSALFVLRQIRKETEKAMESGSSWQSVIASLRANTSELWRAFPEKERSRFLRHLKSYWDTRRHQMAPEVARRIDLCKEDGSLKVLAGRVLAISGEEGGFRITIRRRGDSENESLWVKHVVDCTGLDGNFAEIKHPLIENLRTQGLIRPNIHGLGIDVTGEGRVINAKGFPSSTLFAIGSLRRGEMWESVAVPELRVQAQELAELLLNDAK